MQPRWRAVLAQRKDWWAKNATASPTLFLRQDTAWIREDASWKGPAIVPELKRRWVEITGPAGDAKIVINALNSGKLFIIVMRVKLNYPCQHPFLCWWWWWWFVEGIRVQLRLGKENGRVDEFRYRTDD